MNENKEAYEKAIKEMEKWQGESDTEICHKEADMVLCEFLEKIGYADLVLEYEKIHKWYA